MIGTIVCDAVGVVVVEVGVGVIVGDVVDRDGVVGVVVIVFVGGVDTRVGMTVGEVVVGGMTWTDPGLAVASPSMLM